MEKITLYAGETSPSFVDTILGEDGLAANLTGYTVKFRLRADDGSGLLIDAAATSVNVTTGECTYDWTTANTATAGQYFGWFRATSGANVLESEEVLVEVLAHAPAASLIDLCTVGDVLSDLEVNDASYPEGRIQDLITSASAALMAEFQHEWAPATNNATRRLQVKQKRGRAWIDLGPWDIRNVDSLSLNPESSSPTALDADEYFLSPVPSKHGTYKRIWLSANRPIYSTTLANFGYALADVTGDWGFAAVPDVVRRACVVTVIAWMRRDLQAYAAQDGDGPIHRMPLPAGGFGIPAAARYLLNPTRDFVGAV